MMVRGVDSDAFRNRLIKIMHEKSLTQKDLAELTDLGLSTIKQYTSGNRVPGYRNLTTLANALGVDRLWLAGIDNITKPDLGRFSTLELIRELERREVYGG